jgi:hypothetical protein
MMPAPIRHGDIFSLLAIFIEPHVFLLVSQDLVLLVRRAYVDQRTEYRISEPMILVQS